jgi:hypothetical protein
VVDGGALSWRRQHEVADLTTSSAFTLALLDDTWRWRQRIVEELEFGSSEHLTVTSSFQIEFPPNLVGPFIAGSPAHFAKVLLPLVTREKRPLLRFDVTGPGETQGHLIRRHSIAAIAGEHLGRLAASSAASATITPGLPPGLLEAICVTTPTIFREFTTNHPDIGGAIVAYLSDGLGLPIPHDRAHAWYDEQREVADVLAGTLGEPSDPCSSSEWLFVALPRLEPRPQTIDEVEQLLHRYRRAVLAAKGAGDEPLLLALAEYGRRYELILELEVPLRGPFSVKVSEQRPLDLQRGGWTRQRFGLRAASSFHCEARTTDYAIEIADFEVHDLQGGRVGIPPLEGVRHTKEFLALSSSDPERPAAMIVSLRLRPTRDVRLISAFIAVIAVVAAVVAALVQIDEGFVDALNLLLVPTTFAVTIVLLREQSALAARLQRRWRLTLGLAIAVLWITTLIRLLA